MNKVFGYTKKGGKDWFLSDAYFDKEIESIRDPEGGNELTMPTAIPSPFARLDMVKTAFKNMAKTPQLVSYIKNGDVIASKEDEKQVSDCLDLMELMFNLDNVRDKIKIIIWDRQEEIKKLKNGTPSHKKLAEALELYMLRDNNTFNFDQLSRLYLIQYNHKIIGGTSPNTLFFTSANDLSFARIRLSANALLFDQSCNPLYQREPEFQKYIYLLFEAYPQLKALMKSFKEYLDKNERILDQQNPGLYNEIKNLNPATYHHNYTELDTGVAGSVVEVLGAVIRKRKKQDFLELISDSDFLIKSSKFEGETKPLVLQNNFNKPFRYVQDQWQSTFKVPYLDREGDIQKRWLPEIKIQYPYLTVSDFLEPYLVRLIYPVDKDKFFDGNLVIDFGSDTKGYLLPLKSYFFKYFDTDFLYSILPDGNKPIELVQGTNSSVKVILRIPVQKENEYITFERIYYPSAEYELSKPDETSNKGVIFEQIMSLTLYPFIRTNNPDFQPYYRVQLIDKNTSGYAQSIDYQLSFHRNHHSNPIEVKARKPRRVKDSIQASSHYYVLTEEFDYIQVRNHVSSAIIIPQWPVYQPGANIFNFAIDFGTTYTHIEYQVDHGPTKPLDITNDDIQIATLFNPHRLDIIKNETADDIYLLVEHELLPRLIGQQSVYKFPQRTVLAESHSLNLDAETFALADFNIPFIYEKEPEKDKIQSNLKWARKERGNQKRIEAYFEILLMILRNKVLLNKGNLQETRITWFYPSSMKPGRIAELENIWNQLYLKFFNNKLKPIGISESLAPYFYYKGVSKIPGGGAYKPVVSIDIGGGTSDMVIFKTVNGKDRPLLLSSFRFAANTLFGDGYSEFGAASANGLISKYQPYFQNLFLANNLHDLADVLRVVAEKNKSEDINAFFFSVENNHKIRDKNLFSYNQLLSKDEDLKILFLYFYAAVIYHVADLMKLNQIELPKHIIFSGTGSKLLDIITSNNQLLADFAKIIFEKVYHQPYDRDGLSLGREKEIPKEVTSKGGLLVNAEDLALDLKEIKAVHSCLNGEGRSQPLSYAALNDEIKVEVTQYIESFNHFFLNLNQDFDFIDYFNVSAKSLEIFRTEVNKHLRDYLEEGLQYNIKLDEISDLNKDLEETLFFYPILGTINNLIKQLAPLSPINS
ncbi:MAG: hypothetical protein ACNS62_11965 [Candidatus Cyclobacteriaceae bacterium M3_2C_046]